MNVPEIDEASHIVGTHWGGFYKVLTPSMNLHGGQLGVNITRVPPGGAACSFHYHQREDEVFYVLAGPRILRYGDAARKLRKGDCISCPAGSGNAYQAANSFAKDLLYLAAGTDDPNDICVFPGSGKVYVRSLGAIG